MNIKQLIENWKKQREVKLGYLVVEVDPETIEALAKSLEEAAEIMRGPANDFDDTQEGAWLKKHGFKG